MRLVTSGQSSTGLFRFAFFRLCAFLSLMRFSFSVFCLGPRQLAELHDIMIRRTIALRARVEHQTSRLVMSGQQHQE
jgi:hypothetical protein